MLVVTLPQSAASNPAAFARKAKKAGAQVLEIRGDLTPGAKKFSSVLPLLVSPRGRGLRLVEGFRPAYVDLDVSESHLMSGIPKRAKLIVSFHDFSKTPSLASLRKTAKAMTALRPFALKIVTTIRTYDDLVILEHLRSGLKFPRVSIFGMGEKAHLSRVLSPMRDTFTYSSPDDSESAAPGQLPLSFYALTKGRRNPRILGILGGPYVAASKSPVLHNALFQRHKIDALYSRFPAGEFKGTLDILSKLGVIGYSVTAPFKREAFLLAKKRDALSMKLGVANTLLKKKNRWSAWNTDGEGIEKGYPVLGSTRTLAILGAGGAVPSVIRAAVRKNPAVQITVFARDPEKAKRTLAEQHFASLQIKDLREAHDHSCDTVICAVSEDTALPIPRAKTAIDLRYAKPTTFMNQAKKKGYRVYDGLPMLIHQGLRQFEIFTGAKTTKADARALFTLLSAR